ncbi:hypothetical protein CEXT_159091 [Caerostris extrusa]|uniref:Uncharacterized protein n=1 Tax=Caerostris extrusa TaxID=172846 RepID=A0AAV4XSB9_CAEEX|nr:hypothetical protein CEXT_159091 [Caerostris extrusa]
MAVHKRKGNGHSGIEQIPPFPEPAVGSLELKVAEFRIYCSLLRYSSNCPIKCERPFDRVGYLGARDSPLLFEEVRPSKWRSTEGKGNGHSGIEQIP